MRYLPDGAQMKQADVYTIHELGIPSLVLMERAALQIVNVMHDRDLDLSRALIVCGNGNNGGDGFAVARLLYEEGKYPLVFFAGKEESLSEECRIQKAIIENMGIKVVTEAPDEEYTVIIDAIFGVGLSREISGSYCEIIEWMNAYQCYKVAVDIPSGVCARRGIVLGTAFQADLTVSMGCVKLGCELFPGKSYAGETVPVPIGIDPTVFLKNPEVCITYDKKEITDLMPERPADSHKGNYGRVLMVTGTAGMAGAAYLSAKAAYAVGAGLVQIYTHEDNRVILQQLLPEAIVSCYKNFDEKKLGELLEWADVICIGSGIGQSDLSVNIFTYVIENTDKPCIIDADGLNIMSGNMQVLKQISGSVILTPHMKEMSRLTGCQIGELRNHRLEILQKFCEDFPCVCVLKDSRTAVMENGRHPFINLAGNSAMAKGGSGDVLAGTVAGLKAQGMSCYESAVLGVFLHACGGDAVRDRKGSYSVFASDLIEGIEEVIKISEERQGK